jgi:hypothetical protein
MWFLSQYKINLENKPIEYFFKNIGIILSPFLPFNYTFDLLKLKENKQNKDFVIKFLKCADINICDIKIDKIKVK